MQAIEPEILPLGRDGVLLRPATMAAPLVSAAVQTGPRRCESRALPGMTEVVPALASIPFRVDAAVTAHGDAIAWLRGLVDGQDLSAVARPAPARLWRIPAAFGGEHGPALREAAELAGVRGALALRETAEAEMSVLAIGFAPRPARPGPAARALEPAPAGKPDPEGRRRAAGGGGGWRRRRLSGEIRAAGSGRWCASRATSATCSAIS